MKKLVIEQLQQQLELELHSVVQDSLKDIDENDIMAGMLISSDLFKYQEFAINEYRKHCHSLGLTESEVEEAIKESVSKIFKKYIEI